MRERKKKVKENEKVDKKNRVGFEPGMFRSCVEHSNHYATETPPIPGVLEVLVVLDVFSAPFSLAVRRPKENRPSFYEVNSLSPDPDTMWPVDVRGG